MFKAPTLPWQKKWWNKSTFYLPLERYENENLDVLRDVGDSKRKKFSVMSIQFLYQCWFIIRSILSQMFCKIGFLENIAKFTIKHLWRGFFFNKIAVLRFANLLIKRLRHTCFPVNLARFLRRPFIMGHLWVTASMQSLLSILRLTHLQSFS